MPRQKILLIAGSLLALAAGGYFFMRPARPLHNYIVRLRGENFLFRLQNEEKRLRFYATRYVSATDEKEAELKAVSLVKADPTLTNSVANESKDPPMIYLEEIREVESIESAGAGYTFFPAESVD